MGYKIKFGAKLWDNATETFNKLTLYNGLVSLFNGIWTPYGIFNTNVTLEELPWYYLMISLGNKWVHIFPIDISPKVNVTERLKFELVYHNVAV